MVPSGSSCCPSPLLNVVKASVSVCILLKLFDLENWILFFVIREAAFGGCRPAPRANVGDTHFILELFPQERKLMKMIRLASLSRGAAEQRTHFIHTNTNDFQLLWVRAQMVRGRDTGDNCLKGLEGLRRIICRKLDSISMLCFTWEHLNGTQTEIRPNTWVTCRHATF